MNLLIKFQLVLMKPAQIETSSTFDEQSHEKWIISIF